MMIWMSGVTLRTDEWGSLEPEIASKAKRSSTCIQLVTATLQLQMMLMLMMQR